MDPAVNGGKQRLHIESKTLLWICAVYFASFGCYLPLLLEQSGKAAPNGLLLLRYGFILVPAAVSLIVWAREGSIKICLLRHLTPISLKEAGLCGAMCLAGIAVTCGYSFAERTDLSAGAYPSVMLLAGSCTYLFATALSAEEIAALLLRALLLGSILAVFYDMFSNIVSAALLHMTCNICWLAPVRCNVPVLLLVILFCRMLQRQIQRKSRS